MIPVSRICLCTVHADVQLHCILITTVLEMKKGGTTRLDKNVNSRQVAFKFCLPCPTSTLSTHMANENKKLLAQQENQLQNLLIDNL